MEQGCYTITPDFIESLGSMYMASMINNTPLADLMKYGEKHGIKTF